MDYCGAVHPPLETLWLASGNHPPLRKSEAQVAWPSAPDYLKTPELAAEYNAWQTAVPEN